MTTVQVTCDRCRSPIEAGRTRLVVEGSAWCVSWQADEATGRPSLDLCRDCFSKLGEWLACGNGGYRFAPEAIPPEPE